MAHWLRLAHGTVTTRLRKNSGPEMRAAAMKIKMAATTLYRAYNQQQQHFKVNVKVNIKVENVNKFEVEVV